MTTTPRRPRSRPAGRIGAIATAAAFLAVTAGCAATGNQDTKETTTVTQTPTDEPYVLVRYQTPTNIASAPFRLIYLGSGNGKAATFTIPSPPPGPDGQPEKDFGLDVGESHTLGGYTLRLIGTTPNGARVAVTDPQGAPLGT